jgi:hypothetical protein
MSSFRFATFAAVSTDEQAQDHDSLTNQIRDARQYAERLGGVETCGPFVADGYSRSFYEGLSEAMADIPPLREAMLAAEHNQFDVLIVRYFERLGVVAYPVFLRLGKHKKQLRSVQEPTPIMPPELYDPTKDEATSMMIHMAGLKQDYRINRIINNLRENMPKRIREGLTPSRIPMGYIYVNNKTPPQLDPALGAKLVQARDMLLAGESYVTIAKYLGIDRSRVPSVLGNPYYMGQVSYNKSFIQRSGTKRQQIRQPRSKWTTGQGKHTPIFTPAEHDEIVAEIDRREELKRRSNVGFVFSGLLRCAVCGDRARRHKFGSRDRYRDVIVCRSQGAHHVRYDYSDFMLKVTEIMQNELSRTEREEDGFQDADKSDAIRCSIEEQTKQRARVQSGHKAGVYTDQEAATEIRKIEQEVERLYRKLENETAARAAQRDAESLLRDNDISRLIEFITTDEYGFDARQVNVWLAAWLQEIRVGKEIQIIKR